MHKRILVCFLCITAYIMYVLSKLYMTWFAYSPADATATPSSVASLQYRMVPAYPACLGKEVVKWVCVLSFYRMALDGFRGTINHTCTSEFHRLFWCAVKIFLMAPGISGVECGFDIPSEVWSTSGTDKFDILNICYEALAFLTPCSSFGQGRI